ncbi:3-methyladenine DNA glycosylase [Sinomonas sp. ASV322]|uniref:3-methyladenine DNA glycosylase n=1 Tax=Sinomonas sp. ASV322 TaxID=3041920 RepID=UPI0027DC830D|nr:3-methyladenine DNA glycosylase [Sinomonas sp. ASV322]MDQ4502927.1 3-methyladenine DNA glycosylase [Sinomonas sp. ASV322]
MPSPVPAAPAAAPRTVLLEHEWLARARAHAERAARFAEPFVARRNARKKHPVEDFLFTYYTLKPGQLGRWHPGAGVVLVGDAAAERLGWKYYRALTDGEREAAGTREGSPAVVLDAERYLAEREETVRFCAVILRGTARRPAQFGCFGLHEWAMAYRSEKFGIRHEYLPLRLGPEGTDRVIEEHRIRCTHFDAFRFYTPDAVPLNELQLTREMQRHLEQPGCLHANMDLYKWAYKLGPAVPGELLMDCFELAQRIREMDMQASPYDLSDWGYSPIRIETAAGKAEYVERQRGFAAEAAALRERLTTAIAPLAAALG